MEKKLEKKINKKKFQESPSSSDEDIIFTTNNKKGAKNYYDSMPFNYEHLLSSNAFGLVPIGKSPCFSLMNYTKWRHTMKMH
jgi:hypothetical protein